MADFLKVSVITVSLNSAKFIQEAIESVLCQTYRDLEYIIVDGGSTDNTLDIVRRYKDRISCIISEKDQGIYDAMNKGVNRAHGDILYFLNSDDKFYDQNVVADAVSDFQEDASIGFIYGKVCAVNTPDNILPYFDEIFQCNKNFITRKNLLKQGMCQQSVFCRRWVFDQTGLFNLKYKMNSDYDWLLKAFNKKINYRFKDRYFCYFSFQGRGYQDRIVTVKDRLEIVFRNSSFLEFLYYIQCRIMAVFNDFSRAITKPHKMPSTMSIKKCIQKFLRFLGLKIILTGSGLLAGSRKFAPSETDAFKWIQRMGIHTVIDVGAHWGEAALEFHRLLPDTSIYSFEPLDHNFKKLELNLRDQKECKAFKLALGEKKGKIEMYQSEYSPSSSLLKMGELHKEAFPFSVQHTTEMVEMTTLDDMIQVLTLKDNILLKIDVQGYEMNVLSGSKDILKRVKVIVIEASFHTLYEGQSLFCDVYHFLERNGFVYSGSWAELKSPVDGIPLQQDCIFLRKEL